MASCFMTPLRQERRLGELCESDVVGVDAEALAAHVKSVLADQTMLVRAHAAVTSALAVLLGVGVNKSLGTHGVFKRMTN